MPDARADKSARVDRVRRIAVVGLMFGAVLAGSCRSTENLHGYDGRELYNTYCASCHGLTGAGDGVVAASLSTRPADLRTLHFLDGDFPRDRIAAVVDGRGSTMAHGTREMPVWGERFTEMESGRSLTEARVNARIDSLTDYLLSLQVDE